MPLPRKAQVTADMAVGMMIFILIVSISFYYLSYLSKPKEPFAAALKAESYKISEELFGNVSWTVYKNPVWVDSAVTGSASFELYFQPDSAVDINSISIQDANSTEIPSSFLNNRVVWVANVSAGNNLFYLVYLKNTALSAQVYDTDLLGS